MAKSVGDVLWSMLEKAGVKRCYGIIGDALNPTIDSLRRNGKIEFIHVRHEEFGVFAAVADAYYSGEPIAVCGTAGPGVTHLINGLLDARKEGAPIICIAGDVETSIMDTSALEELNPYKFFDAASLYTARVVNPGQIRPVVAQALATALSEKGPVVISLPGDIASADAPASALEQFSFPRPGSLIPQDRDLDELAKMINEASNVMIFGGDGCREAREEVLALSQKINAPIGFSYRGKQWLDGGNPNAVGMTGLIGYGGAYAGLQDADLVLLLGTDFPFTEFLPDHKIKKVQIDKKAKHIGRRTSVDLGLVGDIAPTLKKILPLIQAKEDRSFLDKILKKTESFDQLLKHYEVKGPEIKPLRPEYLTRVLSDLADDDAMFFADTGTACIWLARHMTMSQDRRLFGSFSWASMASAAPNAFGASLRYPGRQTIAMCGDGGFTMLGLGDLLTMVERKSPVVMIILNNEKLDFVNIEMQEAGVVPFGTNFKNPNFAKVAEAMGAKGFRIEDPSQVPGVLKEALAYRGGPVVIDAVVDPLALALPSHVPGHVAKGFTLSFAKQMVGGHPHEMLETIKRNLGII